MRTNLVCYKNAPFRCVLWSRRPELSVRGFFFWRISIDMSIYASLDTSKLLHTAHLVNYPEWCPLLKFNDVRLCGQLVSDHSIFCVPTILFSVFLVSIMTPQIKKCHRNNNTMHAVAVASGREKAVISRTTLDSLVQRLVRCFDDD